MLDYFKQLIAYYMVHTNTNIRYFLGATGIFLFFLLLRKIFTRYVFSFILNLSGRSKLQLNEKLLKAFENPLRAFFLVIGVYLALRYLPLSITADTFVNKSFRSFLIILIAWGVYELSGSNSFLSDEMKEKMKIDSILIPWLSKLLRFIVVAMAIVLFAHEWGYDVNGFVAGLGLGGLAFALAAKDFLANIFGGMVIIMEKPFDIGDLVLTPSVEGKVEDISFRSTRFRNISQALVTVPNSTLANQPISNLSRMEKRRVSFYLGLNKTNTAEQIENVLGRIRSIISQHPDVHQENITVAFENLKETSLDLLITYFTKKTEWNEYLKTRQEINMQIIQVLNDENVSFVLPGPFFAAGHTNNKDSVNTLHR